MIKRIKDWRLIEEWRVLWKLSSVWAAGLLVGLNVLQQELLPLVGFAIPAQILPWVNAILGVAVIIARAIAQPGVLGQSTAAPSGAAAAPDVLAHREDSP
ncbi:hypothetical protein [Variovorax sp.]|uniref:DUF7940 domain-containing protein n=1 Tax=Variovorax sp. TaxID=1871043 RepID=UPI003BAA990B